MASALKLDLAMTASQRGHNVHLMDNPAVVKRHPVYAYILHMSDMTVAKLRQIVVYTYG